MLVYNTLVVSFWELNCNTLSHWIENNSILLHGSDTLSRGCKPAMSGRFCRITQSVVKGLVSLTARAGGRDGGCYADRRRHGEVLTSRRRSRSSHVSLLCLSSATLVLSGGVGLASKRNHGSSTKWHECKHSHHCFNVPTPLSSQMRTSILKKTQCR